MCGFGTMVYQIYTNCNFCAKLSFPGLGTQRQLEFLKAVRFLNGLFRSFQPIYIYVLQNICPKQLSTSMYIYVLQILYIYIYVFYEKLTFWLQTNVKFQQTWGWLGLSKCKCLWFFVIFTLKSQRITTNHNTNAWISYKFTSCLVDFL